MTFNLNLSRLTALTCLLSMNTLIAGIPVHYASPMGKEKWRMSGNPIRCGLSLVIPNYGIGYFEQFATQPPHFILRRWENGQRTLPTQIIARPPIWKAQTPPYLVTNTVIQPEGFGIFLRQESTLKLLTYLFQGYQADINYISEQGFKISVILSPIHFQKVYSKYQRCLGDLLPFNYESVKETVFRFGTDSTSLTDADKNQLRRIAQWVDADQQIEQVRVLGYADESGRRGYNNAISEYRANAVEAYLLKLGIPQEKLYKTWFGSLKAVDRNDTDAGRAANRSVVVNLIRK